MKSRQQHISACRLLFIHKGLPTGQSYPFIPRALSRPILSRSLYFSRVLELAHFPDGVKPRKHQRGKNQNYLIPPTPPHPTPKGRQTRLNCMVEVRNLNLSASLYQNYEKIKHKSLTFRKE